MNAFVAEVVPIGVAIAAQRGLAGRELIADVLGVPHPGIAEHGQALAHAQPHHEMPRLAACTVPPMSSAIR